MLVEIQVMLSFLFGKNKLESMEKHYTNEEYAKMIYQLYPPHKDNVGYKSRIRSKYQPEWMEEVEIPPSAYPIGGQQQTRTQLRTSPKTYREVNRNG